MKEAGDHGQWPPGRWEGQCSRAAGHWPPGPPRQRQCVNWRQENTIHAGTMEGGDGCVCPPSSQNPGHPVPSQPGCLLTPIWALGLTSGWLCSHCPCHHALAWVESTPNLTCCLPWGPPHVPPPPPRLRSPSPTKTRGAFSTPWTPPCPDSAGASQVCPPFTHPCSLLPFSLP